MPRRSGATAKYQKSGGAPYMSPIISLCHVPSSSERTDTCLVVHATVRTGQRPAYLPILHRLASLLPLLPLLSSVPSCRWSPVFGDDLDASAQ